MNLIREKNTPVMEQYLNLKAQYKDHLLFYRLGDFYELFFDDAIKAAKLLNIVLTKRGNSNGQEIPMCGVPAHSSESYLHKLIDLGFKVAICDQLETADEAKKRGYKSIVKRDVVRVCLTREKEPVQVISSDESELSTIHKSLGNHKDLFELLNSAILDNNLSSVKEGGFINPKYNSELSELSYILNNSNKLVTKLRESYRDLTGIAALKILHNNILGYYVEVSANHKITSDIFIHRQSLANSMRYTTNELKELENKILTARDAAIGLEMKIFSELCSEVAKESEKIALAANALAKLDIRTAFAELAVQNNYVKPIIDDSKEFNICSGRHPVVEVNDKFIANSINLAGIHLITGPNMAGKSTFLRQNALIAVLAHMGSFVPAESAHVGVIDKIFSRVGATDNITAGYSTFMVEMIETATIVNQATDRSLVILDEIGRGTGVYDGLSIAQAVIEHIHNVNKCRAIFATHYHELTKVGEYLENVKCFCMKIKEWKGEVIFLHEVIEGIADESYGIHVAKLAGFPDSVLNRAREVFEELKA
nr:hypothetical protein M8J77_000439 [Diaphorina citri]